MRKPDSARRSPFRPEVLVFWTALCLVSAVAAFAFSPNLREGPISDAQRVAEQRAAARVVEQQTKPIAARAAAALPVPLVAGKPQIEWQGAATRVHVASIGLDADVRSVGFVLQGGQIQYDTPRFEAGQYVGSADPGQPGNLVIGGHVANRGEFAVFSRLPDVRIGDVVEVFSATTMFRYSVTELRVVAPDATAVMARTQDATLTLITCSPDNDHRNRLIVVGKLI